MDDEIFFEKYIRELDERFINEKRQFHLFLCNFATHPQQILELKNVKLIFFYLTAHIFFKSMYRGIMKSMKANSRRMLRVHIVEAIKNLAYREICVLQAMERIQRVRTEVYSQTISN